MMMILFLPSVETFSQQGGNGIGPTFGFSAGISHFQVKEKNINGLVHRGPGFSASALYSHFSLYALQRLELSGGLNFLQSRYEPEAGTYLIQTSINYRYQRLVVSPGRGLALFLGGMAGLDASQGIYQNWDLNHFHWLTSYSLGFSGSFRYELGERNALTVEWAIPLLSLISRTPARRLYHEDNPGLSYILGKIHENPTLESWPIHRSVEMKLGYHRKAKDRGQQAFFWKFNHVNNHGPGSNPINIITHAIGIEFLF